jgi:hypothetical protein
MASWNIMVKLVVEVLIARLDVGDMSQLGMWVGKTLLKIKP